MDNAFTMPRLSYEAGALAPVISAETIGLHYGKHLQTYVDNLNRLVPGSPYEGMTLEEIAAKADGGIGNNAGQAFNHAQYFEQFCAKGSGTKPSAHMQQLIEKSFGSMEAMQEKVEEAAIGLFGSGWAWLAMDDEGNLKVIQALNADNPLRHNLRPLLTIDVWEHAYYVDYRNRRAEYVKAIWDIIDWNVVSARAER